MEEDGSKLQSPHEDCHISPNFLLRLAEDVKGLMERVGDILEEIKEDGNFSEMTVERYDEKKSYLTKHLTEMSRMHKVLADQISSIIRYITPVGFYIALSSDSTVLCFSKTEDPKSCFSLTAEHGNEKEKGSEMMEIADNNVGLEEFREEVKKCKAKNKEIDEQTCRALSEKASEKAAYNEEISKLINLNKAREVVQNAVTGCLNRGLKEKSDRFDALMLDKDGAKAQLETLLPVKSSLQAERAVIARSFENVGKLTNELKLKLAELETEVERQKNVI